jgi:Tol biopolymer transport system component
MTTLTPEERNELVSIIETYGSVGGKNERENFLYLSGLERLRPLIPLDTDTREFVQTLLRVCEQTTYLPITGKSALLSLLDYLESLVLGQEGVIATIRRIRKGIENKTKQQNQETPFDPIKDKNRQKIIVATVTARFSLIVLIFFVVNGGIIGSLSENSVTPTTVTQVPSTTTIFPTVIETSTEVSVTTPILPTPTPFGGGRGQIAFMSLRQGGSTFVFLLQLSADEVTLQRISFSENTTSGNYFTRGHNAWSSDGTRLAFICNKPPQICVLTIRDTERILSPRILADYRGMTDPDLSWSSDGNKIIYNCLSYHGDGSQICQIDVNTLATSRLGANEESDDWDPDISPDGSSIAFISRRGGQREFKIFVMDADGRNIRQLSATGPDKDADPDWSPDGTEIAFVRNDLLFVMNANGTNVRQIGTTTMVRNPNWSPDGTQIVFQSDCDDDALDCDIALIRLDGTGFRILTETNGGDFGPIWQP